MKYQIFLISLVFLSIILVFNVPNSFGHGLGTETMPSVMIDGTDVTLQVASNTNLIRRLLLFRFLINKTFILGIKSKRL